MFWWRAKLGTSGRRPCWSTAPEGCLLPYPLYAAITLAEMGVMYGVVWANTPPWGTRFVQVRLCLHTQCVSNKGQAFLYINKNVHQWKLTRCSLSLATIVGKPHQRRS